jgi:hypothetical protein
MMPLNRVKAAYPNMPLAVLDDLVAKAINAFPNQPVDFGSFILGYIQATEGLLKLYKEDPLNLLNTMDNYNEFRHPPV